MKDFLNSTFQSRPNFIPFCLAHEQNLSLCRNVTVTYICQNCQDTYQNLVVKFERFLNSTFQSRPNFIPFCLAHEQNLSLCRNVTVTYICQNCQDPYQNLVLKFERFFELSLLVKTKFQTVLSCS